MLFNSGFADVLGITGGLRRKGDVAVADTRIHLSVRDGVPLSRAQLKRFDHNELLKLRNRDLDGAVLAKYLAARDRPR